MQLYTRFGSVNFSVEEYKRPKFKVNILPFDGNYILNDTVTVNGNAKAFTGSNITDATVAYRIIRKPIWRAWWYYRGPLSSTEIQNGTVETNKKGEFTIKFKAIPDLSVKKSDYIDFNYNIIVDVTDINGETQTTEASLRVGYVDLKLDLNIPSSLQKSQQDTFKISSLNINNEFTPAKGVIKIYKLEDNEAALRKRLWTKPDKYLYTKEEWQKLFPGNVYEDENNIKAKEKENKVFEYKFDTEESKDLI